MVRAHQLADAPSEYNAHPMAFIDERRLTRHAGFGRSADRRTIPIQFMTTFIALAIWSAIGGPAEGFTSGV